MGHRRSLGILFTCAVLVLVARPTFGIGLVNTLGGPRGYGTDILLPNDDGYTSARFFSEAPPALATERPPG